MEQNHLCNFGKGHHEHFCEIILNLNQWLKRCHLKDFLPRAPTALIGRNNLCNFGRGHYGEQSCETDLNLDQWLRRQCCLKKKFTDDGGTTD